ncbi:hypothetical protein LCGC14_2981760 [marine sediment metagenome]|uniref:Sugar 3,4-ketoisomerase QdtA cupin domain-containing protein n=1 Tax=marine sediment metagenome TaxID=412755 RepID=A0A0F8XTW3_9ZZZZ
MEFIYSRVLPGELLHVIKKLSEVEFQEEFRKDIIDADNFIQCSSLKMDAGHTFKPHKHIYKDRHYPRQIAQESWVVIRGSVRCVFYDLDDTILSEPILKAGDASFTLAGGHTYVILEDNTTVYEFKTGPYEGQEFDKTFI